MIKWQQADQKKNLIKKAFQDLVGLGCKQEEICWFFRDETGKPANIDTLTRWCKREFDMTFQEYFQQINFKSFYDWAASRNYQIFFSNYNNISDKRFKLI